jgi:hypothetical protein
LLSGSFEPVETSWEEWLKDACDPALRVFHRDVDMDDDGDE